MKKFINFTLYASILCMALSFTSCQSDPDDIVNEQESTMAVDASTASLLTSVVSHDGSFDNIVDGASCFAVRFPYTVDVNGVEITIDSIEDLRLIEAVFDAFEEDVDILEFIFPITITLADYTEIVVENREDLMALAAQCVEGGDDDDIECIDVVYPVTFFTFNTDEVLTGTVTVNNDRELRRFMAGLSSSDLISIDYPVTLKNFEGEEIIVNSNAELAAAIEAAREMCDEDDDDDFNDDDFDKERLDNVLTTCPWLVREVRRNEVDQTEQYLEYLMTFDEDGTVVVNGQGGSLIEGTWMTRVTDNGALLKLEFNVLVDFTLEWLVYEINEHKIKLFGGQGNRIILEKACDFPGSECTLERVDANLSECLWQIASSDFGETEVAYIDFSNKNIHAFYADQELADEGNWSIEKDGDDIFVTFNDLSLALEDYNDIWKVTECSDDRFKLVNDNQVVVVIERVCN